MSFDINISYATADTSYCGRPSLGPLTGTTGGCPSFTNTAISASPIRRTLGFSSLSFGGSVSGANKEGSIFESEGGLAEFGC